MSAPIRILILDESPADAERMIGELRQVGLTVDWARRVTRADYLAQLDQPPDLILGDYALPQLDALAALHLLGQRGLDVPFIVMVSPSDVAAVRVCMQQGAAECVFKDRLARLGPAALHALERRQLWLAQGKTETALRRSEELFRQLAENIGDVFWIADPETDKLLYVSPAYENIWGKPREDLFRHRWSWLEALHPDDHARVRDAARARILQGTYNEVYRIVRPDGAVRWIQDRAFPIRTGTGVVNRIAGVAQDITERMQVEEELRHKHYLLHAIVEGTSDAIFWKDRLGRYQLINQAGAAYVGLPPEEAIGKVDTAWFAPDTAAVIMAADRQAMERGENVVIEVDVKTADQQRRTFLSSKFPFRDATGQVVGMIGFARDITARKRTEQALALFRALLDRTNDTIEVVDPETGRFLDVNEHACQAHGYTRDEYLGLRVADLDPLVAARSWNDIADRVRRLGFLSLESEHRRKDGSLFPVEININYIHLDRPYHLAVVRDISERKRAESALHEYARRLVEVQEEERRHLARELHDEIGPTLTGLKLMLETADRLPSELARPKLREACGLLNELIDRVRSLSLDLRPSMLDDHGLLPSLLWFFSRYTAQTEISVDFEHRRLERRFPAEVETAAYRIVQEALTNVARHARVKRVAVKVSASKTSLNLQIQDKGVGFQPTQPQAGRATGGLTGMRERAILLRGSLNIQSAPGQGTRISVELPLNGARERGSP